MLCTNEPLHGIKGTRPLSFITSKEIDFKEMPPVSSDPESWEGHLLHMCDRRLSLVLAQEKKEFEADCSEPH